MKTLEFTVKRFFVGPLVQQEMFMISLADRAEHPKVWLELQRALEEDDLDAELGMDTYCLGLSGGPVHYGGVHSCLLSPDQLRLELSTAAAHALGVAGFRLRLQLEPQQLNNLREALKLVFVKRHPAQFAID